MNKLLLLLFMPLMTGATIPTVPPIPKFDYCYATQIKTKRLCELCHRKACFFVETERDETYKVCPYHLATFHRLYKQVIIKEDW